MIDLNTRAVLTHVNARKEGPKDDQVPALDVKLEATLAADMLAHFHGGLRGFLFDAAGDPRFPQMEAVKWTGGFRQLIVAIAGLRVYGDLRKFRFAPITGMGPFMVAVGFTLTFRPSGTEASTLVELLGEMVPVQVVNDGQLPLGNAATAAEQDIEAHVQQAAQKLRDLGLQDGIQKVSIVTPAGEEIVIADKATAKRRGEKGTKA